MREVSEETFFSTVGQLNVHPRCEKDASYWETPNRVLMGKTEPGWLNPSDPKRYFIAEAPSDD